MLRCGSAVRYCLFAARYCYHEGVRLAAMWGCSALLPLCSALLLSRRSSPCCAVGLRAALVCAAGLGAANVLGSKLFMWRFVSSHSLPIHALLVSGILMILLLICKIELCGEAPGATKSLLFLLLHSY